MMKRTGLTFLAAMGLYVAALVLPREAPDDLVTLPLDLAGIEEVVVVSPSGVGILFVSAASPQLEYPVGKDHQVTVTREGRRLRIVSDSKQYQALSIRLAPTVRRLVAPEAMIVAKVGLEALAIETTGELRWDGDVASLSINDATPCPGSCVSQLDIRSGRIGHLSVTSRFSQVSLAHVDTISRTTLTLGREARFSIDQASRIPDITLLPHPADPPAPEAKIP